MRRSSLPKTKAHTVLFRSNLIPICEIKNDRRPRSADSNRTRGSLYIFKATGQTASAVKYARPMRFFFCTCGRRETVGLPGKTPAVVKTAFFASLVFIRNNVNNASFLSNFISVCEFIYTKIKTPPVFFCHYVEQSAVTF